VIQLEQLLLDMCVSYLILSSKFISCFICLINFNTVLFRALEAICY